MAQRGPLRVDSGFQPLMSVEQAARCRFTLQPFYASTVPPLWKRTCAGQFHFGAERQGNPLSTLNAQHSTCASVRPRRPEPRSGSTTPVRATDLDDEDEDAESHRRLRPSGSDRPSCPDCQPVLRARFTLEGSARLALENRKTPSHASLTFHLVCCQRIVAVPGSSTVPSGKCGAHSDADRRSGHRKRRGAEE
jgi:hypothetical protein